MSLCTAYHFTEVLVNQLLASIPSDFSPILADYIWIGGGTLGLVLLIIIIVLVLRR
jgi:hypothetical protein